MRERLFFPVLTKWLGHKGNPAVSISEDLGYRVGPRLPSSYRTVMIMSHFFDFLTYRKPSWHFVGDSHINGFRRAYEQKLIRRRCTFTEVGGATAVGLRNPNSVTNAVDTFKKALLPKSRNTTPVIQLGEVDCGFVIWYRAKKYGESVEGQFRQSITAYTAFVDELLLYGYNKIVLTGATVPTIVDDQDWGEVANARREVTSTIQDRTELTLKYNAELQDAARRRSLPFIDLSGLVLDKETGLVSAYFRNPDPTDHHLDPDKVAPLWATELNRIDAMISTEKS